MPGKMRNGRSSGTRRDRSTGPPRLPRRSACTRNIYASLAPETTTRTSSEAATRRLPPGARHLDGRRGVRSSSTLAWRRRAPTLFRRYAFLGPVRDVLLPLLHRVGRVVVADLSLLPGDPEHLRRLGLDVFRQPVELVG